MRGLYKRGWDAEAFRPLFRFIDWMMDLPESLAEKFRAELVRYEEQKRMPYITSVERMGIEKGLQQGEAKGLLRGIEVSLKAKFGAAGLELLAGLRTLSDVQKLQAALDRIDTATSLDELRILVAD